MEVIQMSNQELNKLIARKISYYMSQKNISQQDLADYMGVSQATISNWCKGSKMPRMDKIDKLCTYFNISRSDLMEDKIKFTPRDNKDIKKDLDSIMERLTDRESGPASYDGEDLSPEAAELFKDELEIALRRLKLINKEKYNPNKNKK